MRKASFGSKVGFTVLTLGAVAIAAPSRAEAAPETDCSDQKIWTDVVGAERLYWDGIKALESEGGEKAASLFAQSASLRVMCDPQVFALLRMSALLYLRAGNIGDAARTMYRAAEVGVRTGKLLAAAHAYLDYGAMSNKLGDTQAAVDAATRAEAISQLPALTDWERSTILDRMDWQSADAFGYSS